MTVFTFDPLADARWPKFVEQHPSASAFHTRQWLEAIRRTYGYRPVGFTTSGGGELANAIVLCSVDSWLTGRRLVSLPFSDHCQPLASGPDLEKLLGYLAEQRKNGQRYIELRPRQHKEFGEQWKFFAENDTYSLHAIDLRRSAQEIYGEFHESCIRRKIKRAERENLTYSAGRSEDLVRAFINLNLLTRRRHKMPPQPAAWFRNVVACLGDMVTVHLASKGSDPVASIVTILFKKSLIYKYGCSDGRFSNLGATPFLFWKVIQQAKQSQVEEFDLGRSDQADAGLIAFKEHLGAESYELRYFRNTDSVKKKQTSPATNSLSQLARETLVRLPDWMFAQVGQLLYRHIG